MVLALAGRRIDARDAPEARFPAERAVQVAEEIRTTMERLGATVLVCSAAYGADSLGLEAAGRIGIRRRVVLPFDRHRFRETSVVDRPGTWGGRYDAVLDEVERDGDVVVLGFDVNAPGVYAATNDRILEEAETIARDLGDSLGALIVWDGKSRGPDDVTAHFLRKVRQAGLRATEINTLT